MDWTILTGYYNAVVRWLLPIIAVLLLIICIRLLFRGKGSRTVLAVLVTDEGERLPVTAAESAIGRSAACDIQVTAPTVSRRHAVLTRDNEGFRISDIRSKGGLYVNEERVGRGARLELGDTVKLADVRLRLEAAQKEDEPEQKRRRNRREPPVLAGPFLLTLFQLLACLSLMLHDMDELPWTLPACFLGLVAMEWICFRLRRFEGLGVLLPAFFLSTLGLCVAASAAPASLLKQFAALVLGVVLFWILGLVLRDIDLTMKLRYAAGLCAILLLAANLLFGESRYGARNWINLGFITIQPSEFVKVAFVFAGCATLERLMTARNTVLFLLFSAACIGPLFLMRDFGTAVVFFVGMVIIAYMRSGDWRVIAFFSGAAAVGAPLIILLKPYIADRFASYLHAWEYAATSGYQQTRTMIAIGSGGLLGLGGGNGNLDRVAAADTDLVFGILCEEWGLIVALCCAACLVILALYAATRAARASSAYYAIAACAAAGMLLLQAALNLFGSVDLLPLTGITFPLVSNGGSSMAASFAMLAFIESVQNTGRKGEKRR